MPETGSHLWLPLFPSQHWIHLKSHRFYFQKYILWSIIVILSLFCLLLPKPSYATWNEVKLFIIIWIWMIWPLPIPSAASCAIILMLKRYQSPFIFYLMLSVFFFKTLIPIITSAFTCALYDCSLLHVGLHFQCNLLRQAFPDYLI